LYFDANTTSEQSAPQSPDFVWAVTVDATAFSWVGDATAFLGADTVALSDTEMLETSSLAFLIAKITACFSASALTFVSNILCKAFSVLSLIAVGVLTGKVSVASVWLGDCQSSEMFKYDPNLEASGSRVSPGNFCCVALLRFEIVPVGRAPSARARNTRSSNFQTETTSDLLVAPMVDAPSC
jgi:hypothetical protein